jgi:hypothetical protein
MRPSAQAILGTMFAALTSTICVCQAQEAVQHDSSGNRIVILLHVVGQQSLANMIPGQCKTLQTSAEDLFALKRPTQTESICRDFESQRDALKGIVHADLQSADQSMVSDQDRQRIQQVNAFRRQQDGIAVEINRHGSELHALFSPTGDRRSTQTVTGAGLGSIALAELPTPHPADVQGCVNQSISSGNIGGFKNCIMTSALPQQYRIAEACLTNPRNDAAQALFCSTHQDAALNAYNRVKSVRECMAKEDASAIRVVGCAGLGVLNERDKYYARCVLDNEGDLARTAVCGLAPNLTPEQQIALSCAVETGAEPHAYVACTGGQLLDRELNKCLQNGFGGPNGCYGDNNEFRKFFNGIDSVVKQATGGNSAVYQSWKFMKDNVYAPGPNHEVVKFINNGIRDIQQGPGPNNDIVKAGNALGNGMNAVAQGIGGLTHLFH